MNLESLMEETARYLGISDNEEKARLSPFVLTAIEMCKAQTGQTDFDSSESARQWVKFAAAQMYADRFGELNNKEGSAMAQMMNNLRFTLRMQNIRKAVRDENSNDP